MMNGAVERGKAAGQNTRPWAQRLGGGAAWAQ
jgi:hypothetical protein